MRSMIEAATVVTDAEPALDVAGRSLAVAQDDRNRLVVRIGRIVEIAARAARRPVAVIIVAFIFRDGVEIVRHACVFRCATTCSTSSSETKGPCTRGCGRRPA